MSDKNDGKRRKPIPPLHSRFQKGRSGNPGGRPKKQKTQADIILECLNRTVQARGPDGQMISISLGEAIVSKNVMDAMNDIHARKLTLDMWTKAEAARGSLQAHEGLTEEDTAVLVEHRHAQDSDGEHQEKGTSISLQPDGTIDLDAPDISKQAGEAIINAAKTSDAYLRFVAGDTSQAPAIIDILTRAILEVRSGNTPDARKIHFSESFSATLIKANGTVEHRAG